MIRLFDSYMKRWEHVSTNFSDPRVNDYFLMDSLSPTLSICTFYALFVYFGPRIMKNRKPFNIKNILIGYNLFAFLASGYLFSEFLAAGWGGDYSFGCQPVDYSNNPKALRMVRACWLCYLSKIMDLMDTVFFILRKKNNQVTVLHVFHHFSMPINCWFGTKFVPGGFGTFGPMVNTFIHFVMYFYYFLSSFGETFKKYLWWKRYMTQMQMLQFVIIIIHGSQLFYIQCNYPKVFMLATASCTFVFLVFFANFFIHEYYVRSKKRAAANATSAKPSVLPNTNADRGDANKKTD